MSNLTAASCEETTPALEGTETEQLTAKPCCECPETKKARDACIIEKAYLVEETSCEVGCWLLSAFAVLLGLKGSWSRCSTAALLCSPLYSPLLRVFYSVCV
ncbi:hypothetical protein GJAV_G00259740 [Gymnothorax javanicus]|nr:hypothetical protein GJAV_G00259740 [Gymnothorax javanicus]